MIAATTVASGEVRVVSDHNDNEIATPEFKFANVRPPCRNDAATQARFLMLDGRADPNSGGADRLNDGEIPDDEDVPAANFFFDAGLEGGRLLVDLGKAVDILQVNTYSWHVGDRGPQVYTLYAGDAVATNFAALPKKVDPSSCGWKRLAQVDTRPQAGERGGQYGVSISGSNGTVGAYRYLLFDMVRTEAFDAFGNTFYSEIDIIDRNAREPEAVKTPAARPGRETFTAGDGTYRMTIDTSGTTDLTEWARNELAPVVREWYPKIVQMLYGDKPVAPRNVRITFVGGQAGHITAATTGTRIWCMADWFRQNLKGEARGCVVHELVHVAQQYNQVQGAAQVPGWLPEGMADYIRWFLYEPEARGAEIPAAAAADVRYDANYRISANFINWVATTHDQGLLKHLHSAIRSGGYDESLWKTRTGRTLRQLNDEWKESLARAR